MTGILQKIMMKLVVAAGVVAALVSVCFLPDAPISGTKTILGTLGYDIRVLSAPTVHSTLLDAFSYLITRTRFGPLIRRLLLNDNRISDLRDLAAQIEHAPMHYPMARVNAERYESLTSQEAVAEAEHILVEGFGRNFLPQFDRPGNEGHYPRTITEYHEFYKHGRGLPSQLMTKAIAAVKQWESEGFRVFSSILPEDVLAAARESDARWQAGTPLSVFDGVPVAFKDMMDVEGHVIYEGKNPHPSHAAQWVQPEQDDLMVTRLRQLGAIVFGVTIEVEGGVSPLGFNAHFQGPVSPYSMNR